MNHAQRNVGNDKPGGEGRGEGERLLQRHTYGLVAKLGLRDDAALAAVLTNSLKGKHVPRLPTVLPLLVRGRRSAERVGVRGNFRLIGFPR